MIHMVLEFDPLLVQGPPVEVLTPELFDWIMGIFQEAQLQNFIRIRGMDCSKQWHQFIWENFGLIGDAERL